MPSPRAVSESGSLTLGDVAAARDRAGSQRHRRAREEHFSAQAGRRIRDVEDDRPDERQRMVNITRSERNIAHRLIEEFMLAANRAVAGYLLKRGIPALHRVR